MSNIDAPRPARRARRSLIAAAAAAASASLATFGTAPANAGLIIDVRAIGGSAAIADPKSVLFSAPGDTVTLGLFARVSGTNGIHDETIQSVYGSVVSAGNPKFDATSSSVVAPFNGTSFQNGSIQDIDSDGDLDLGSAGSASTGKFFARSSSPTSAGIVVDANTGEVQIGVVTMTYTDGFGADYAFNFVPRTNNGANVTAAALWFEDGSTIGKNPSSGSFTAGTPVTLGAFDPEPGSLGLLSLCSVGLLARRRR
jgi:hypothetical protein